MSQFVVVKRGDGQLAFRFKANNGETILSSEGYSSKFGVENGIKSVKQNAPYDSSYVRVDRITDYSFRIKSNNGQITGLSDKYLTREARERAIDEVKRTAPDAVVEKYDLRHY